MRGRHSREEDWGFSAISHDFRLFLSAHQRAALVTTVLTVPMIVAGGFSLLGRASRTPALPLPSAMPPSATAPSAAASTPRPAMSPDLTLRARTAMAEPAHEARRHSTARSSASARPGARPSGPLICFRRSHRIWCLRGHDARRWSHGSGDDGRYDSSPRR